MSGPVQLGRIAIIGTGQIGTTIGRAIRRGAPDCEITLHDRSAATARRSRDLGAGDRVSDTIGPALGCETVILAVPVSAILDLLDRHGASIAPGTLVIDTGSVKLPVVEAMRRALDPAVRAVGGHPLAGTERSGPEGAEPDALRGAAFALCPVRDDPAAMAAAAALVEVTGARPVVVDAAAHDSATARTIGLPHLLAFALRATAETLGPDLAWSASTGYRGATRLAASDPAMVATLLAANAAELRPALDELRQRLDLLVERLDDEAALRRVLAAAS